MTGFYGGVDKNKSSVKTNPLYEHDSIRWLYPEFSALQFFNGSRVKFRIGSDGIGAYELETDFMDVSPREGIVKLISKNGVIVTDSESGVDFKTETDQFVYENVNVGDVVVFWPSFKSMNVSTISGSNFKLKNPSLEKDTHNNISIYKYGYDKAHVKSLEKLKQTFKRLGLKQDKNSEHNTFSNDNGLLFVSRKHPFNNEDGDGSVYLGYVGIEGNIEDVKELIAALESCGLSHEGESPGSRDFI